MNYKHPDHPPGPLPREYAGILNFNLHTAPEDYGFYPWTDAPQPEFDSATHKAVPSDPIDKKKKTAKRVWNVVPLSEGEMTPIADLKATATSIVYAERERRLAAGFDFNFEDERGLHHIGMSPSDMVGWDEVTKWSDAAIALGAPDAKIMIATGSGAADVSAIEWKRVLLAASAFRQPIWHASFALQAAIDSAPDRAALAAIDVTAGWPA